MRLLGRNVFVRGGGGGELSVIGDEDQALLVTESDNGLQGERVANRDFNFSMRWGGVQEEASSGPLFSLASQIDWRMLPDCGRWSVLDF